MAGPMTRVPAIPPIHTIAPFRSQVPLWMRGVSKDQTAFKTMEWRRRLVDCFEADTTVCERMMTHHFGLSTMEKISTSDSNASGVVFTFDTDEYLGQDVPNMSRKVAVKVAPYRLHPRSGRGLHTNSSVVLDPKDPTNVEMRMLLIARDLILSKQCPNIALLFRYFVAPNLHSLEEPGRHAKVLENLRGALAREPPEVRREVMVMLVEFSSIGSVRFWRSRKERTEDEWRVVLFQVAYTLAVLQRKIPGWRHNDAHQANFGVDRIANRPNNFYEYDYRGTKFWVPARGASVRLLDFDWVYAPEHLENGKTKSMSIRGLQLDKPCNCFDLHRFLNHIHSSTQGKLNPHIRETIGRLYPPEYLGQRTVMLEEYRLTPHADTSKLPTPESFLQDEFFAPFLREPIGPKSAIVERYAFSDK
jgi:hypothetical protein